MRAVVELGGGGCSPLVHGTGLWVGKERLGRGAWSHGLVLRSACVPCVVWPEQVTFLSELALSARGAGRGGGALIACQALLGAQDMCELISSSLRAVRKVPPWSTRVCPFRPQSYLRGRAGI